MKAYNSGGHYYIHIDEGTEFPYLTNKPLEANLQDDSGVDLGKKVVLSYNPQERNPIVNFIPPESSWDELREIHITITREQYEMLGLRRLEVSHFGGGSNIDLYLEETFLILFNARILNSKSFGFCPDVLSSFHLSEDITGIMQTCSHSSRETSFCINFINS